MADSAKEAAIEAVRNDPAGSVKTALSPSGRDYLLLSALALAVQDASLWHPMRDAGVVSLFTELLLDEWSTPEIEDRGPGWVFSLTGLCNVLVAIKKDEKINDESQENGKQYALLRAAYPRIETVLFKNRASANVDGRISVLALGLYHFSRIPQIETLLFSPGTLGTVGHCWQHAVGIPARKISCVLLRQILFSTKKPSYALETFFKLTPFDSVVRRVRTSFADSTIRLDASHLAVELVTADAFVEMEHPTGSKWADVGLHCHIVALLEGRLQALDVEKEANARWVIVNSAAPILNNIVNAAANPAEAFQDLIVSYDFLTVASESLKLIAPREDSFDSAWFRIFKMLIHTLRCTDTACRVHGSPEFISLTREHFKPLFLTVLDVLDNHIATSAYEQGALNGKLPSADGADDAEKKRAALWQSVLTWRALAATLGIHEDVERGYVKVGLDGADGKGGVCWWAKCTSYKEVKEGASAVPYKRCSACHTVFYCSPEHQKMDWKEGGHKEVCHILQNA